jgi:hypothetical protein
VPKDADSERLVFAALAKAVEFKGFAGAMVLTNYCQQQVSDWTVPNKRPPHR